MPTANTRDTMVVYQPEFVGGLTEMVEQAAVQMNAGSANAITMRSTIQKGDFEKESFYKSIDGLVSRRDTSSTADANLLDLTQGEFVAVKANTKIGPVGKTVDSWRKIGEDPATMSFVIGQMTGNDLVLDYINTAFYAATAALESESDLVLDVAGGAAATKTMTYEHMIDALALMGDRSSRVVAWVMHSKVFHDLMKHNVAEKITNVADVTIYQASVGSLNRIILVTDSPALVGNNTYKTLGLVANAIDINQSEGTSIYSQVELLKENVMMVLQGETAHTIGIKGYGYTGDADPDNAELGNPANWNFEMADLKSGPGIMLITE